MSRIDELNRNEAEVAAGWKTAAAVVIVGLLVAVGGKVLQPAGERPKEAEAAAIRADEATEYFPSGYTLETSEPEEHIEAF